MHASEDIVGPRQAPNAESAGGAVTTVLAWMAFLVPTVGVPSELMLQDTLKSAVLAFGTLIAACIFGWQRRKFAAALQWHALLAVPLALMVYALGSMVWSHAYLAGVEAIRWFLLSVLLFVGLNVLSRNNAPKLLWGLHAGAVLASVWAALQFWWGWDAFPQAALPASTFANRNFFAEYAVAVIPLSVWLLVRVNASRWLPWLALSVAFNLVVILMTGTRSALIALCVIVPIVAVVVVRTRGQLAAPHWGRSQQIVVGLVVVLGVAILGNWPTHNPKILQEGQGNTALQRSVQRSASITEGTEYTQGSFSVRATMWLATARMLVANPLIGVGAGAWEVEIPLYQRTYTTLETDYYAHNEFLQLLSEYGLVMGGLCLAFLLAYLLKTAALTWQASAAQTQGLSVLAASIDAPLRAFTLTSLLALLIVSNAGFPLHLAGGGMLLMLCLGLLAGSDLRLGSLGALAGKPFVLRRTTYSYLGIALTGCFVVAFFVTVQAWRAESRLVRAITLSNDYARAEHAGLPAAANIKQQALQLAREGVSIHPHYRKLTAEIAEPFAARGDWKTVVWILESLAASRPHVVALWTGLTQGYAELGEYAQAEEAFTQVKRLKPNALSTITLHATWLTQAGRGPEAAAILERQFDAQAFDGDMAQAGYAIGYKTANWPLAIRSLELQIARWPDQSTSGYFRLGQLYAEPRVADFPKALQAFRAGLDRVPATERQNYRNQIPSHFREQM